MLFLNDFDKVGTSYGRIFRIDAEKLVEATRETDGPYIQQSQIVEENYFTSTLILRDSAFRDSSLFGRVTRNTPCS